MLSYEKWKVISESLGGAIPLGIKTPETIGVVGNNTEPLDFEAELEEAKKCLKKKMDGDVPSPDEGGDKPPFLKKKDEDPDDADADAGGDDSEPSGDDDKDEEPSADADADSGGDDSPGDSSNGSGDEESDPKAKPTLFQKKKQKKSMKKNMKKEDNEFLNRFKSLQGQMNHDPNQKYWDGLSEDAVYPETDPNQGLADMQPEVPTDPQPGEVGFSPYSKVAGLGSEYEESTKPLVDALLNDSRIPDEVKKDLRG